MADVDTTYECGRGRRCPRCCEVGAVARLGMVVSFAVLVELMDTQTAHTFTVDELTAAALEHASIPWECGRGATSPLVAMIPDDQRVPVSTIDLVEQVTGVRVPQWGGATHVTAARCRAVLNRWGVRQVGVMALREHVRARVLWSGLTDDVDDEG